MSHALIFLPFSSDTTTEEWRATAVRQFATEAPALVPRSVIVDQG